MNAMLNTLSLIESMFIVESVYLIITLIVFCTFCVTSNIPNQDLVGNILFICISSK